MKCKACKTECSKCEDDKSCKECKDKMNGTLVNATGLCECPCGYGSESIKIIKVYVKNVT